MAEIGHLQKESSSSLDDILNKNYLTICTYLWVGCIYRLTKLVDGVCPAGLPVMQPPHQSLTENIGLSAMVSRQKGHEGQRLGPHSKTDVCCHVLTSCFENSFDGFDCCFSRLNLRQEAKTRFNERLAQSLKRFNGFWSSHCNKQWLNTTSFKIIRSFKG